MSRFVSRNPADCANFLLGAVLEGDVAAVKGSCALGVGEGVRVVVAGKEPLRSALADVFAADGAFADVEAFAAPEGMELSAYGAYLVAKENLRIHAR